MHRDGDWHGALHVWVGGIGDDGSPFVVFQRRSRSKDSWAGALDVAVGGHFRAGETLEDAVREAEEEIGLRVAAADLTRLGRRFAHGGSRRDNEVQDVFALRSDLPLRAYTLHPDEVDAVVSMGLEEALALFDGRAATARGLELARGGREAVAVGATVEQFAGGEVAGYPSRALRGLAQVVGGAAPEPFELR